MIESEGVTIVVDTGPDFRQQMLREKVENVDAILLTHEHKDHIAGLDDVRAFNYLNKTEMSVFGMERVLERIRIEYAYAFAEYKYPGVPLIELKAIADAPFTIKDQTIIPIPVMHARLPILGFRFADFTYITDTNYISKESMDLIKGSKVLVLNALQKEQHVSHYTLEQAVEVAQQSGVPFVYFTHMSHRIGCHTEVSKGLPNGIQLAWDGLHLEL